VRGSREIGEATFPLYAFHMPLLVLAASLAVYDRSSAVQKLALLVAIIASSFVLVPLGDALKRRIASVLRGAR
jgi:peptidoglycan/LPS O-acetylase OafA/YrhL